MDKKTMTIVCVAVVAVVAIAAVAVFMMNNNNSSDDKEYNATELANKFIKDYDGTFGKFTVADGSTADQAIMGYTAQQKNWKGEDLEGKTRAMNIKIVHFDSKDKAATEFEQYIKNKEAPYYSKNGTKGETMVTQTNKLGMASEHATVLNGTKNITPAEGGTIKTVKASDFGADQIYVLYASKYDDEGQQYSMFAMVMLDGKNLVVINQSSKDEFSMYYNVAIMEQSDSPSEGEKYVTVSNFEDAVRNFCKAF